MKLILTIALALYFTGLFSQTIIKGNIEQTIQFQPKLYIIKHNQIDPHPPVIYDSISINPDGSFLYKFSKIHPQEVMFKILLPRKSGDRLFTYGTVRKNFLYISVETPGDIVIDAKGDSLFYSAKLSGANSQVINFFSNLQKPFFNLERAVLDSIATHQGLEQEYKQKLMPLWMETIEELKPKILAALDTATSATSIFMGLQLLFESNFGKLDSSTVEQYLRKVKNQDLLLVRTIRELARSKRFDRKNLLLPNVQLVSASGKIKNLYDFKSDYTLIDFWASWCSPCRYANRNELPHLYNKYKKQIELIGITIDEDKQKWKRAITKDSTSWAQFIDKGYILKTALDIQSVPVYILVDKDHKIIFESVSVYQIHEYIKTLLNEN